MIDLKKIIIKVWKTIQNRVVQIKIIFLKIFTNVKNKLRILQVTKYTFVL